MQAARRCGGWMLAMLLAAGTARGETWPQFRGPDGQGHAAARDLPSEWSENQNVRWVAPIDGRGWSSPVLSEQHVWLTTAIDAEGSLRAVCLDRATGSLVHDIEVFKYDDLGRVAAKNSHASPTPVLDGRLIIVHFGAHGTACLADDGRILWRTQLAYDHRHGPGGSPVVWNDLVIIACDGPDEQFLVALDKRTGQERWRVEHQAEQAYSTPTLVHYQGQDQLITSRANALIAFAPADGRELWRCSYSGHSVVPRPVVADDLVYCCTGYFNPSLLAVRLGGSGDVVSSHVAFSVRRQVPLNPSLLVVDKRIYMVSDLGVLTCLDATHGKELWRERVGGNFSASPTYADGKIYLQSEEGVTLVIRPGDRYDLLATNQLPGSTLATPAFADGAIYLRTDTQLYCLAAPRNVRASATRAPADPPRVQRAFRR